MAAPVPAVAASSISPSIQPVEGLLKAFTTATDEIVENQFVDSRCSVQQIERYRKLLEDTTVRFYDIVAHLADRINPENTNERLSNFIQNYIQLFGLTGDIKLYRERFTPQLEKVLNDKGLYAAISSKFWKEGDRLRSNSVYMRAHRMLFIFSPGVYEFESETDKHWSDSLYFRSHITLSIFARGKIETASQFERENPRLFDHHHNHSSDLFYLLGLHTGLANSPNWEEICNYSWGRDDPEWKTSPQDFQEAIFKFANLLGNFETAEEILSKHPEILEHSSKRVDLAEGASDGNGKRYELLRSKLNRDLSTVKSFQTVESAENFLERINRTIAITFREGGKFGFQPIDSSRITVEEFKNLKELLEQMTSYFSSIFPKSENQLLIRNSQKLDRFLLIYFNLFAMVGNLRILGSLQQQLIDNNTDSLKTALQRFLAPLGEEYQRSLCCKTEFAHALIDFNFFIREDWVLELRERLKTPAQALLPKPRIFA